MTNTTRRAFCAAVLPAVAAPAALATTRSTPDPLIAMCAAWRRKLDYIRSDATNGCDDESFDALVDELNAQGRAIALARATTCEGAACQIEVGLADEMMGNVLYDGSDRQLLLNVVAFLRGEAVA